MWFIGVEVEQKTSAPPPKKNPGSAPGMMLIVVSLKTAVKENAVVSALEKTHKWTMIRQRNRVSQTRIVLKKIMGIVATANAVTIAFASLHL